MTGCASWITLSAMWPATTITGMPACTRRTTVAQDAFAKTSCTGTRLHKLAQWNTGQFIIKHMTVTSYSRVMQSRVHTQMSHISHTLRNICAVPSVTLTGDLVSLQSYTQPGCVTTNVQYTQRCLFCTPHLKCSHDRHDIEQFMVFSVNKFGLSNSKLH